LFVICRLHATRPPRRPRHRGHTGERPPVTPTPQLVRLRRLKQMRPIDRDSRAEIRLELARAAKALAKAAEALKSLLQIELPYGPEVLRNRDRSQPLLGNENDDTQNGFRVPPLQEAAEHLRFLKGVAAGFSDDEWEAMSPEIASAWRRVNAMNDAEYYPHFAH